MSFCDWVFPFTIRSIGALSLYPLFQYFLRNASKTFLLTYFSTHYDCFKSQIMNKIGFLCCPINIWNLNNSWALVNSYSFKVRRFKKLMQKAEAGSCEEHILPSSLIDALHTTYQSGKYVNFILGVSAQPPFWTTTFHGYISSTGHWNFLQLHVALLNLHDQTWGEMFWLQSVLFPVFCGSIACLTFDALCSDNGFFSL